MYKTTGSAGLDYETCYFTLYQHINYGGHSIIRLAQEKNMPIHLKNMTLDRMWTFFWINGPNWNDAVSSYAFGAT